MGVAKSQTRLSNQHLSFSIDILIRSSQRIESRDSNRYLSSNVHSSIIHNTDISKIYEKKIAHQQMNGYAKCGQHIQWDISPS